MKPLVEAQLYRDAGEVKRYHVKRTHRTQSIAEHTFGMLMLIEQVAPAVHKDVLSAVLRHDLPELFTGDVPAPIKRAHPALGPLMDSIEEGLAPLYVDYHLSVPEQQLIKWADRMELVLWCMEEVRLGNKSMAVLVERALGWILAAHVPICAKVLTEAVVADAASMCIHPSKGAELEKNA